MNLSFLLGGLHLNKTADGDHVIKIQNEKKAILRHITLIIGCGLHVPWTDVRLSVRAVLIQLEPQGRALRTAPSNDPR